MFGLPEVPCGKAAAHDWHSDGRRFCPGVPESAAAPVRRHSWMMTAADLGLDLDTATRVTYAELHELCLERGVVGDTYATGEPGYRARDAYAVVDGQLYTAPALRNSTTGAWPAPGGGPRPLVDHERMGDRAAGLAENAQQREW